MHVYTICLLTANRINLSSHIPVELGITHKFCLLQFSEAFSKLKEEVTATSQTPYDEDIINAAESVCDDAWKGEVKSVVLLHGTLQFLAVE